MISIVVLRYSEYVKTFYIEIDVFFQLPASLPINLSSSTPVDSALSQFQTNPYAFSDGSPALSPVVSFSLSISTIAAGALSFTLPARVVVKNLSSPIYITVPNEAQSGTTPLCRFWDTVRLPFLHRAISFTFASWCCVFT